MPKQSNKQMKLNKHLQETEKTAIKADITKLKEGLLSVERNITLREKEIKKIQYLIENDSDKELIDYILAKHDMKRLDYLLKRLINLNKDDNQVRDIIKRYIDIKDRELVIEKLFNPEEENPEEAAEEKLEELNNIPLDENKE
jgi:hypothetical protein